MADVTDFVPFVSLIVGFIVGFIVIATMLWNTSKQMADLKNSVTNAKNDSVKEFTQIEAKHVSDKKALENEIQRQIAERNEDLSKATLNLSNELNTKQEQLNLLKSDVKSLLSKIEVAYTNIASSEKIHDELKAESVRLLEFMTKWTQRVEDRIENLRKEYLGMFMAFHGKGNKTNATE